MKFYSFFFSLIFFLLISSSRSHTPGAVTVDTYTFDKILSAFDFVLAKFDDKYPSGDNQDEFKKFAEMAVNTKKFLVVEIPITEDDSANENQDLAKQYKITTDAYPVYKLFLKDQSKPIDYNGDKTAVDIRQFVIKHTNVWFGLPGTLETLDSLAREFFEASSNKDETLQQTLIEKAREELKTLVDTKEQKNGQSYIRTMELLAKQGIEYLQREIRRLESLLKAKMTDEKRLELQHRANILRSFKSISHPKDL